jgi:hypothetical protein
MVLISFYSFAPIVSHAKIIVESTNQDSGKAGNGKHRISSSQKTAIENDLNEKSGLKSIKFDRNGELSYDKSETTGNGSEKFRQAITGAIDDEINVFQLSNYSGSKDVIFAEINEGTTVVTTAFYEGILVEKSKLSIYRMRIDFADYENSEKHTSDEVLRSHTIGITLFHEINHKVSYDPNDPTPAKGVRPDKSSRRVRGVIENTNMVRKQLSLMLRKSNRHGGKKYTGSFHLYEQCYQLPFVSDSGKRMYLRWKPEENRERKV